MIYSTFSTTEKEFETVDKCINTELYTNKETPKFWKFMIPKNKK